MESSNSITAFSSNNLTENFFLRLKSRVTNQLIKLVLLTTLLISSLTIISSFESTAVAASTLPATISGKVTNNSGTAIGGICVAASENNGTSYGMAVASSSGSYTITGLNSGSSYSLSFNTTNCSGTVVNSSYGSNVLYATFVTAPATSINETLMPPPSTTTTQPPSTITTTTTQPPATTSTTTTTTTPSTTSTTTTSVITKAGTLTTPRLIIYPATTKTSMKEVSLRVKCLNSSCIGNEVIRIKTYKEELRHITIKVKTDKGKKTNKKQITKKLRVPIETVIGKGSFNIKTATEGTITVHLNKIGQRLLAPKYVFAHIRTGNKVTIKKTSIYPSILSQLTVTLQNQRPITRSFRLHVTAMETKAKKK